MRSTIFTSLSVALIASSAMAQTHLSEGCYARDYSADHLAANPDQVVARMVLRIWVEPELPDEVDLAVWTANQGHVRKDGLGGQRFDQFLICGQEGGAAYCAVECDGGLMEIEQSNAEVFQFRTQYLLVGEIDDCGGAVDLAERPNQPVSYRLTKVEDAVCLAEFDAVTDGG